MTIIDLTNGKQATVGSDKGVIRAALWANGGGLGVDLTPRQAIQLRAALLRAILDAEKASTPD